MLIKLQDCDNRIAKLMNKKEEGPLKIRQLESQLKSSEAGFQKDNEKLESLKKQYRKIDQDILEIENKMEKASVKLNNIKSNKEYTAALKEIEDLQKIKMQIEDNALEILEETENLEKKCSENKQKESELRMQFQNDKDAIEKELEVLHSDLESQQAEGISLSQVIDHDLLKDYLFLKERKGGVAISAVIGGICQVCNIGIPPQRFNELIGGKSLLTCPNCRRIIYWGDDEHYQKTLG